MADGIGAALAPAHATAFQSIAYHRFAGRLHRAGANLPAVANVSWVVHSMFVISEVLHRAAVGLPHFRRSQTHVEHLQPGTHRWPAFMLELMTHLIRPTLPRRFVTRIDRFAQFDQVFLGVPEIQDTLRFREVGVEEILQTDAAVGDGDLLLRRRPTNFNRLAVELAAKRLKVVKTR